jgi:hypothetical protein
MSAYPGVPAGGACDGNMDAEAEHEGATPLTPITPAQWELLRQQFAALR